jgi:hypothetical protein
MRVGLDKIEPKVLFGTIFETVRDLSIDLKIPGTWSTVCTVASKQHSMIENHAHIVGWLRWLKGLS